ncbi:MAG TPA: hypothetical protein VN690_03075 [Terriglobales bacterium]|nr:hypothetical protein [Terriglobales bacterium]
MVGSVSNRAVAGVQSQPAVQQQLARIANSATFRGTGRLRRFLEFVVAETLAERRDRIKEYVVGVEVFDKPTSFDPRTDPIVRVQARRLRALLERYYSDEGGSSELLIELPKGGYLPLFTPRAPGPARMALAVALATRNTVAVQAFADHSRAGDLEYFCKSLRQEVVCALAKLDDIRTIDAASGSQEAGAALLVGGSVSQAGEQLRVILQVVDAVNGCYLWSESVDGSAHDAFTVQQQVAGLLAAKVHAELAGPNQRRRGRPVENLAARNLYLQGRYHLNQRTEESLRKAAEFFERAKLEEPQFALAHSGLADAYSLLGHYGVLAPAEVWTKTADNASTAVLMAPDSVEALTSLAHVKASQDWDWAGAERQFRQAILLDSSYSTAHHWYAMSFLVPMSRLQEALEELRIAQSLDPISAIIARDLALVHVYRREYDLALAQCDHTIELNPHFSAAFWTLALIQELRQEFEEAIAACQRAIHLAPSMPRMHGALAHLYAHSDGKGRCLEIMRKLREMAATRYVSPMEFASLHFALGQLDAGFEWLAKAVQDRCMELLWVNVDPRLEVARQDRRFAAALRPMGLMPRSPRRSAPERRSAVAVR